ncbi:MAG: PAS domain S-box protein [Deltaproteobacteria bacterium]|nr:MAG: PAS domain S-box protein [Deltaproteobacteria bacterium]
MKLFWKVYSAVFICFVTVVVLTVYTMASRQISDVQNRIVQKQAAVVSFVTNEIELGHSELRWPFGNLKKISKGDDFLFWWIVTDDETIYLADNDLFVGTKTSDYFPNISSDVITDNIVVNNEKLYGIVIKNFTSNQSKWSFWFGFSTMHIADISRNIYLFAIIFSLLALTVLGVTLYFVVKHFIRPIETLALGVEAIGKGNLDYKVEITSDDELAQLARSFNRMTEDLKLTTTSVENLNLQVAQRERAEEALHQRVQEMIVLNTLAHQVSSSLMVDQVVQAALEGIVSGVSPNLALLFMREGDQMLLRGLQSVETRLSFENFKIHRVGECLCGLACSEGKPVYSPDIHADPRCTLEECKEAGLVSLAALPLQSGDNIIGVLVIGSTEQLDFEVQATFLESLTSQVVTGLRNATLYEEVQQYSEQLEINVAGLKKTEKALRESEERYRTVLEANPDPVVVYDMEGKVIYLNPAFTDTFGWTIEERLGKKMDVFVPEESWPETKIMIDKALTGESFSGFETCRYTKEGNTIPVSISAAVYWDRDDNPVGSVVSLRDISEQKQLQAQLQHAQKLEAVGTLAGGIAHEFNNLLQAVQGYAELLLLRRKKEEPTYRELEAIVRAAKRGGELSQQLLTFSRKVESKLRPVDLNFEVDRAIQLLSRTVRKMIEIEFHSEKELKPVNADPAQIEQLVVNLALNARDAMPDGGKVTIGTENVFLDKEYCRRQAGVEPGEYVLLTFSDTGHGMDKETRMRMFEPFFTTKGLGEGTGIGLAIVYGIVKNHGGQITCSSEPEAGTIFKIYLPAIEHKVQFEKQPEPELLEGGTETILLVDDEEFILDLGKQIFARCGYTVLTALDGETALEFYRKEQGNIDLVILDLVMPGMSGRECLEGLRNINPRAKVVIASGYSDTGPMKEAIEAGAKSFISKPYEMKQLLQVAREVLDED